MDTRISCEFFSMCERQTAQISRRKVWKGTMPDVQDPNRLAVVIHLVEDSIDMCPLAKQKAPDFALRLNRLASERTPIRKPLERIQAVNEFFKPLRPSSRSPLNDPIVDLVCVGFGGLSENDLVSHVFFGILFQTASMALHGRLPRLRVRV